MEHVAIEPGEGAVEFYTHQALLVELPAESSLHQAVKRRLALLTKSLALRMRDYFTAAVWGELRHSGHASNVHHPAVCRWSISRSGALLEGKNYDPKSIAQLGMAMFAPNKADWRGSYGGESWYKIAKTVARYGVLPDAVFVDQCFGLTHNSGAAFDKTEYELFVPTWNGCWEHQYGRCCVGRYAMWSRYRELLDARHRASRLEELLEAYVMLHAGSLFSLSTLALLQRAAEVLSPEVARYVEYLRDQASGHRSRNDARAASLYLYSIDWYPRPIVWGGSSFDLSLVTYNLDRCEGCREALCPDCGYCHSCNDLCSTCCSDMCSECGLCHKCDNLCDKCCTELCSECGNCHGCEERCYKCCAELCSYCGDCHKCGARCDEGSTAQVSQGGGG